MRRDPVTSIPSPLAVAYGQSYVLIDMTHDAMHPRAETIRLYHPLLPWSIDVKQPYGVTLAHLFITIYNNLMTPIRSEDFWNVVLTDYQRSLITEAFHSRCKSEEDRRKGIRRIDFLGRQCVLTGIVPGFNGQWEMKTSAVMDKYI